MGVTKIRTLQIEDAAITPAKMNVLSAKGDICIFDTAHNRIPVGTDTQVLTADSTQAAGVKWASPSTGLLFANTTVPAGNTIANVNVETNFTSSYSVPANFLTVGKVIRVTAAGVLGTATSASLTLKVKLGTTALNTSGAILLTNSQSNAGWRLQQDMTVISVGANGTIESQGIIFLPATVLTTILKNTSPTTINTTQVNVLQLSATWSGANVNNTITLRQLIMEMLN